MRHIPSCKPDYTASQLLGVQSLLLCKSAYKDQDMHRKVFVVIAALVLSVNLLHAQRPARNAAKERAIVEKLAAIAPGAVDSFQRATAAMDKQDYQPSG